MCRTLLTILLLAVASATAGAGYAGTFDAAVYIKDPAVNALTRDVANQQLGRDLLGNPYATAVIGNVDVYDRFPYIEARYFQIVSDPAWDRLLLGEIGAAPVAYDGAGGAFGRLDNPRGLSVSADGRVFVADTDNDRVLVFRSSSEYDRITLEPLFAIDNLRRPHDVAYSDAGTPFDGRDDRLYVADTGRNAVRRYELGERDARLTTALGELGSGPNRFAGPVAIAVGHSDGAGNDAVYVSDAHNGRIVELHDTGAGLAWVSHAPHSGGIVTAIDTDHWGNVYAASPQRGTVTKYTATLEPLSAQQADRPRAFHILFANVTDHRSGEVRRAGQGSGVLVESWNRDHGLRLFNLGVELEGATAVDDGIAAVSVILTDHAHVVAEVTDRNTGALVARHDGGVLAAGRHIVRLAESDFVAPWERDEYRVTLRATSTYDGAATATTELDVALGSAGTPALPARAVLIGNSPNPFNPATTIRFTAPAGTHKYSVDVYDVRGRHVRRVASGTVDGGTHGIAWNGRNDQGESVSSGIYLYRIALGAERLAGKMVLVK